MRNLLPIIATAALLPGVWGFGATATSAEPAAPAVKLAQLDLCVGPDCRRDRGDRYREDRYRRFDDRDYGYDRGWRYRRGGCRDVTVRERRGDEVVVRHDRRCD